MAPNLGTLCVNAGGGACYMNKALFKDLCPTSSHCTHRAVELSPRYSFTMTQLLTALSTERTLRKTWQCGPRQSQTRLPKPRPVRSAYPFRRSEAGVEQNPGTLAAK